MSFNANDWIECTKLYIVKDSPDQFNPYNVVPAAVVYFRAVDHNDKNIHNIWQIANVSSIVPTDCKAICLSGTLVITHGNNAETATLFMYFRRDATVLRGPNYIFECTEPFIGGGQRDTACVWVPLTQAKTFEWKWQAGTTNSGPFTPTYQYPAFSSFGANLRVIAAAS